MQFQPKPDESSRGRVQRVQQARQTSDDAFKGGDRLPPRGRGLKAPWMTGTGRLWTARHAVGHEN